MTLLYLVDCQHPKRVLICCYSYRVAKSNSAYTFCFAMVASKYASLLPHCRPFLSVDNTEERVTGSSSISGCLRLIKDLHPRYTILTALAVSEMAQACLCVILPKFPMHSPWLRFCRGCMDGLSFPALV